MLPGAIHGTVMEVSSHSRPPSLWMQLSSHHGCSLSQLGFLISSLQYAGGQPSEWYMKDACPCMDWSVCTVTPKGPPSTTILSSSGGGWPQFCSMARPSARLPATRSPPQSLNAFPDSILSIVSVFSYSVPSYSWKIAQSGYATSIKRSFNWPCNITDTWSSSWYCSAHSRLAPSQWETMLLCNDVSHWLGARLESALILWITLRICFSRSNMLTCTHAR